MKKNGIIKSAAVICGAFSAMCVFLILFMHIVVYGKNGLLKIFLDIVASGGLILLFISVKALTLRFSGRITQIVLISASLIIMIYGVISTPYNPCHDALDLHNILNYMLDREKSVYYETYMNFWINNKLTAYCYLPFVLMLKNVTAGVRFLNGILLIGSVLLIYFSICRLTKLCGETILFILSLTAPYMLAAGPYIYLPSIFLSAAALFFFSLSNKKGKALFFVFTAMSFVLRPTCAGFILAFFTLYLIFCAKNKYMKNILYIIFALFICFSLKTVTGHLLYKTGAHIYPSMQNSAAIWTFELGTRPNGIKTGTCSYTPFSDIENPDSIQRDFNTLWNYYYNYAELGTNSYSKISEFQKKLRQKIINRTTRLNSVQSVKQLLYKSGNLFGNIYIPYYYRANINDTDIDISDNLNSKYFLYQNSLLLIFFVCMIVNMIRVLRGRDFSNGIITAAGLSAFSVIIILLLLTEVSKKYMFDFFVPMVMVAAVTFAGQPLHKNTAAMLAMITAAAAALIIQMKSCKIPIFHNAETRLLKSGESCTLIIDMEEKCTEDYFIKTYSGEYISLNGKQSVVIHFPDNCFNAFTLFMPNGDNTYYSSQNIS